VVVDFCRVIGGESAGREQLLDAPVRWPRPSRLLGRIELPARQAEAAARLGLFTLGDLIEHVPVAHQQRAGRLVKELRSGEEASVEVELRSISLRPTRRRNLRIVEAVVSDQSGSIKAVWFNQQWLAKQLEPGTQLRLFGKYKSGVLQVREHSVVAPGALDDLAEGENVSIYPATEGLKSQRIRELIEAQRGLELELVEPLSGRLLARERLLSRADALAEMHFPREPGSLEAGRLSLAFEELLLQQTALRLRRADRAARRPALELPATGALVDPWLARLPFSLTDDQRAAIRVLDAELADRLPMQRLLMGEVGSGKTVVALSAMLRAAENGAQAALMAPTETLAEQHFGTLDAMLPEVPLALLTGSTPAARRRETLARLASGELPIVVGTHALIEPAVVFNRLTLAVVDEQHRFGVRQRAALDAKAPDGFQPHVLHMTATPIPRTLALVAYGDLEVTQIKELPGGRRPIETRAVGEPQRAGAYDLVRKELRAGRQAYVVCPLVTESELLQARAASVEAEKLAAGEFREFKVGLIHGQLSSVEKAAAMEDFALGATDVLVATSVIEVGIDVPNATVMIVEDADRYGISQLHQLRGRVGRGEHQSWCLLFGNPASRRIRAVAEERDGFKLAQVDLELRGAGEELGTRQSGLPQFRFAALPEDSALLERAHATALSLLSEDPALGAPDHQLLRDAVIASYGDELDPIPA
jgi:ATP-dependent DNA helicase RecG